MRAQARKHAIPYDKQTPSPVKLQRATPLKGNQARMRVQGQYSFHNVDWRPIAHSDDFSPPDLKVNEIKCRLLLEAVGPVRTEGWPSA
jgi:hypothetical protein